MVKSNNTCLVSLIATGLTLSGIFPAHAGEAVVLQPSSPWHLDMAENKCRLARIYGEEGKRTLVFFEQWEPSDRTLLAIAGEAVRKFHPDRKASYSFGPDGEGDEFSFTAAELRQFGKLISTESSIARRPEAEGVSAMTSRFLRPAEDLPEPANSGEGEDTTPGVPRGLPALDSSAAKGITRLNVSQRGNETVLELGSMEAPLAAMNTCMEDLVKSWGFDPEQQKRVVSAPKIENLTDVAGRVSKYYPRAAERKGAQADFHLRLTIDEKGAVEDCRLVNQTLAPDFDMRFHPCAIFKEHAVAKPALDAGGQPVESYYTTRIVYRMN